MVVWRGGQHIVACFACHFPAAPTRHSPAFTSPPTVAVSPPPTYLLHIKLLAETFSGRGGSLQGQVRHLENFPLVYSGEHSISYPTMFCVPFCHWETFILQWDSWTLPLQWVGTPTETPPCPHSLLPPPPPFPLPHLASLTCSPPPSHISPGFRHTYIPLIPICLFL